jgi:hypothetical protein
VLFQENTHALYFSFLILHCKLPENSSWLQVTSFAAKINKRQYQAFASRHINITSNQKTSGQGS